MQSHENFFFTKTQRGALSGVLNGPEKLEDVHCVVVLS